MLILYEEILESFSEKMRKNYEEILEKLGNFQGNLERTYEKLYENFKIVLEKNCGRTSQKF